ncbi:alpha/beta fold hydrolase [Paenibacillus sp. GCM10012307]|uniref:Alpha/beta hydrolase n=1 Tax=Paenibacillus roseus TaxID=2798579 RepID=A0A934MWA4_9BACL|nr:alpha/beta hydrolase [Paenibacillus roseus]MBJ6362952.1 alpha/beta hydrolase [Paenibacillus roseus]
MQLENINGTVLHYSVKGEGIPIIFVHPPLLTGANFRYQQVQLSDEFKVVTFDIRGHGQSGRSLVPISYRLIAEDIKQLMDRLGLEKAYICGYSTGGTVVLQTLLAYPERFAGAILASAMSEASDWVLRSRIKIAAQLSRWGAAMKVLMLGITWGNADQRQTFRNLFREARRGNRTNIHQYYRYSLAYSCTEQLKDIKNPVLLLYGKKDWGFKRYLRILENNLPNNDVLVFKGESHQLPTKAADGMNAMIRRWIRSIEYRNETSYSQTNEFTYDYEKEQQFYSHNADAERLQ